MKKSKKTNVNNDGITNIKDIDLDKILVRKRLNQGNLPLKKT